MPSVLPDTEDQTPADMRGHTSAYWALAALATPVLLSSLGAGIANVGLPFLTRAFDAPFQSVQWVVLAYLLATTSLIVSVGRLADLLGRRRLLLGGLALFTVASTICSLAPTLWVLVAARAAQGLGAAVMMTLSLALVGDTTSDGRTGRAMGVLGSMSAVGTALGPSLGGLLLATAGWRWLFLVNAPLGVLALVLVRQHVPRDRAVPSTERRAFDYVGTLLLAASLGAYALAMTFGRGRFGTVNVGLLLAAALGVLAFIHVQARSASPLIQFAVLRNGALGAQLLTSLVSSAVVMATLVVGPFYLARGLGLTSALVGAALSVGPFVSAVTAVPAGHLADRIGARGATLLGLLGMAAGSASLFVLPARLGVAGYLVPLSVITAGYAFVQAANSAAVMSGVSPDQRGVVAALLGLSRNLGLLTGASAMGAVFAAASGVHDVAAAAPASVAAGMRATFGVAATLIIVAFLIVAWGTVARGLATALLVIVVGASSGGAQSASPRARPGPDPTPAPTGPYPLAASGWGPRAGTRQFVSRWAEDWTAARDSGHAPPLKAMPLGGRTSLTVSAEARLRYDVHANGQLRSDNDYRQTLFRGIAGADLRYDRWVRMYGELGTGRVDGRRSAVGPNFQNDASLQQLFVEARGDVGGALVGAMVGRQEFADGPRQLVSVSDGPNLHRTWNGVRVYAHGRRLRVGAFDLRVTRPGRGDFDETVDRAERLQGANASLVLARGPGGSNVYLDALWTHSEHPALRSGGSTGRDARDTYGTRLWGRRGRAAFDWTLLRQTGRHRSGEVNAWGLFAVQSLAATNTRWKPRLDLRLDVASGGARDSSAFKSFHALYASSAYVGEGQFLGLGNLVMITPGVSVSPTPESSVALEYGLARRLDASEAVRAGGMRAYDATLRTQEREIGGLLRLSGSRAVSPYLTLFFTHEHLVAAAALHRADLPSGSYSHLGATLRY